MASLAGASTHDFELVSTLTTFKGTEYLYLSVFADEESIKLLTHIDGVLQRAGWKRVGSPGPFPYEMIEVFGKGAAPIAAGLTTGVQISVDSTESLTSLQSLPLDKLRRVVKAAVVLNSAISSNLFPPQADMKVNTQPGTSGAIRISVGKKP